MRPWLWAALAVLNAGPLGALDFAGLQAAADRAAAGMVLEVPAGRYEGELIVRRPLTLRAAPGAVLVHRPGTPGPTLWIQAPDVRIEGLTVVGSGEGTRRDHTAIVVTGDRATLTRIAIREAWAGVWVDGADEVIVEALNFTGLAGFPFWQRGDGVRVTGAQDSRMAGLTLTHTADGVYVEDSPNTAIGPVSVEEARYGIHVMFGSGGTVTAARTRRTVVGFMAMETSDWLVRGSRFTEGYRSGSAGVRQIRTNRVTVEGCLVARQASGIELLDARGGRIAENRIEENAVAWTLGGDNRATLVTANTHRANLVDVSGTALKEADLTASDAHNHGKPGVLPPVTPARPTPPTFEGNFWDAWSGFDFDGDGRGETPYRFDPEDAVRTAARPWSGIFLASPWSVFVQTIPGGSVLDLSPLVRPPVAGPP